MKKTNACIVDFTLPLWVVKGGKKDMACMKALYFSLSLFLSIGISLIDINYTCRPGSISKSGTCIRRL